MTYFNMSLLCL